MVHVPLTPIEIRALNAMRRRPDAAVLAGVVAKAALAAREQYESTPASEENRLAAVEANVVSNVLFKQVI